MIVETCKGCKHKARCNGRVSKNSAFCDNLRSGSKTNDTVVSFFRKFRGLTKDVIMLKYAKHKENK